MMMDISGVAAAVGLEDWGLAAAVMDNLVEVVG
jgi:hypothetical protein